jgi:hypothetical protein
MVQHPPIIDTQFTVLQEIDLVALQPGLAGGNDAMLAASRESIVRVFREFLAVMEISDDRISVTDGFFFLFNEPRFLEWNNLNWWDQRNYIQTIKDHRPYKERAHRLLTKSYLASYIDYSDEMVAKSTEQDVKRAWMRKRLVLQESFWNAIDTISHAAYFQKKYQEMFPAFCVLLCKIIDKNDRKIELVLGIDNGTGFLYKKKSRESAMFNLINMGYKFFFRSGVFYIGGLELGLLETESELSCHGSGAVVFQGW